ncbi:hypothetical protein ACJJTC_009316 [Scirpophaga incertulas]
MDKEQHQIINQIEICGLKEAEEEKPEELAKNVAKIINQNTEDVVKAYRKKKRHQTRNKATKRESSAITVILREGTLDLWLDAAKKTNIQSADVGSMGDGKVYLRESLTPATAYLLWKTKEMLRGEYRYIWCKHGTILARRQENDKIITIRSLQELESVSAVAKVSKTPT